MTRTFCTIHFARIRCAFRCLAVTGLLAFGNAHATDIDCDPSVVPARPVPAHRMICESALFSMGYQRIFADQQRQLKTGSITEQEIAAFRKKRDACDSAACLDAVLREWKAFAAQAATRHKP
ncbi:MAG: hypothetical protein AAB280_03120 [Pseudomonadota bacterium]